MKGIGKGLGRIKKVAVEQGKILVEEEIDTIGIEDSEALKKKLRSELNSIIRQVKSLKERAEEIKGMLAELEKQDLIGPAR